MEEIKSLQKIVNSQAEEIAKLKEDINKIRKEILLPPHLKTKENALEVYKTLLESSHWPAAIDPDLVCNVTSEQDKQDRAEGIIDLIIDSPLQNLKFLDFGCGEGHVVNHSKSQKPKLSIGYDIENFKKWQEWETNENIKYTTNWKEVKANGPYNAILMYDVIDHIRGKGETFKEARYEHIKGEEETPVIEELIKVKSVLAPYGKIYIRCHPWCSRHGTHLYHQINKAYVHLIFTEKELEEMGYKGIWTRKYIHTTYEYEKFFQAANLNVLRGPQIQTEPMEPFFSEEIIRNKINSHWPDWDQLRLGLKQQFIDYILG